MLGQTPELWAVDDAANPLRQWHVQFGWYPYHPPSSVEPDHLWKIQYAHYGCSRIASSFVDKITV